MTYKNLGVLLLILAVFGCTTGPIQNVSDATVGADTRIIGSCNIILTLNNSSHNDINNSTACKNYRNTITADSEQCERKAPVGYVNLYPTGILGLIISPLILVGDEISKRKAQSEADENYTRCMEARGYIRNGYGTYTFENGNVYQGYWKDWNFYGHGSFRWKDGGSYDGEWNDGKKSGTGTDIYADGVTYKGSFEDGARNGHGVQTWPDGRRFDGVFRDDRPDGHGVFTEANGERFEGTWSNGCFKDGDRWAAVDQITAYCR